MIQAESDNWLEVLAVECKRTSQAKVASRLGKGVSDTMISQALNGVYPSSTGLLKLQTKVEGAYMGKTVNCPVSGEIARDICIDNQGRPFAATNPQRVALFIACPDCPNRSGKAPCNPDTSAIRGDRRT